MTYEWIVAVVVVIAIVLVVIFLLFYPNTPVIQPINPVPPDKPLEPIKPGSTVDCEKYGNNIGSPTCKEGTEAFRIAGVSKCYKDVWSVSGGKKTAICTVDWGSYGGIVTKCGVGIYYLNYGDPCPMIGENYYKTAVCTCQYKGVITASQYCQSEGFPDQCPTGSDLFAGRCYANSCTDGYTRTARCTCEPK